MAYYSTTFDYDKAKLEKENRFETKQCESSDFLPDE